MEIKSFRGKTAMLSTEIMEKNEQLGNVRPRQGTVPCPTKITYSMMEKAINEVYKDMPELLEAALEWFRKDWKGFP